MALGSMISSSIGDIENLMNTSDVDMSRHAPAKESDKEHSENRRMSFKRETLTFSPQLPITDWDHDNRQLFCHAARSTANVFYARIQKETEEFLYHLEKQTSTLQEEIPAGVSQNDRVVEDEALAKLKYLLLIHTTCSQITNLLVNSP